jgi:hypothetical protein
MKSNDEKERLAADAKREANWKRWGPYLSERLQNPGRAALIGLLRSIFERYDVEKW